MKIPKFCEIHYTHISDRYDLIVNSFWIQPEFRRKGYGTKIIKKLEKEYQNKVENIIVPCNTSGLALRFWLSLGYDYFCESEKQKGEIIMKHKDIKEILEIECNTIVVLDKYLGELQK